MTVVIVAALLGLAAYAATPTSGAATLRRRGVTRSGRAAGLAAAGGRAGSRLHRLLLTRRQAARARAAVIEVAAALGAELRTGATPVVALERAAAAVPGLVDDAAAQGRLGGDVVATLQAAADGPGAAGLRRIGAAWAVAASTGSGLAAATDRIADVLREEEALRHEVSAQLSGARATARLMATLPVLGVALGMSMGANPLRVLFGTPYGLGCLVGGLTLAVLGLVWTERLAHAIEDQV